MNKTKPSRRWPMMLPSSIVAVAMLAVTAFADWETCMGPLSCPGGVYGLNGQVCPAPGGPGTIEVSGIVGQALGEYCSSHDDRCGGPSNQCNQMARWLMNVREIRCIHAETGAILGTYGTCSDGTISITKLNKRCNGTKCWNEPPAEL